MFFSPSGAVLSAILLDEYLILTVRAKEGDPPSLVLTAEVDFFRSYLLVHFSIIIIIIIMIELAISKCNKTCPFN